MHPNQNISWRLPNGCRRILTACCYRGAGGWYVPNLEWQNLVQRKFGANFSNRIEFFGTKYPTHMDADKWLLFPMDLSLVLRRCIVPSIVLAKKGVSGGFLHMLK